MVLPYHGALMVMTIGDSDGNSVGDSGGDIGGNSGGDN
jgi:hypothetical protein